MKTFIKIVMHICLIPVYVVFWLPLLAARCEMDINWYIKPKGDK